ncbi:MAG TPA: cell division protein FtsL [Synergistales bacterium]|nr:cell division protein FtsL [Synergistales bacterium]
MRWRMGWIGIALLMIKLAVPASAGPLEEWAAAIDARDRGMASAASLRAELAGQAGEGSPVERWRRLLRGDESPEARAADAVALVDALFPAGDPARWEEVKGFWRAAEVPLPLAALDAVFYGAKALLSMQDGRAPWLARVLVEALAASDRARTVAFRAAPEEVREVLEELSLKAPPPPTGGWPSGKPLGRLPFAHGVSGWITETRATMEGMTFLNAAGVPVGGTGVYAWDRERGRIYRVLDSEPRRIWLFYDD